MCDLKIEEGLIGKKKGMGGRERGEQERLVGRTAVIKA
jgi:hypothetical protein